MPFESDTANVPSPTQTHAPRPNCTSLAVCNQNVHNRRELGRRLRLKRNITAKKHCCEVLQVLSYYAQTIPPSTIQSRDHPKKSRTTPCHMQRNSKIENSTKDVQRRGKAGILSSELPPTTSPPDTKIHPTHDHSNKWYERAVRRRD